MRPTDDEPVRIEPGKLRETLDAMRDERPAKETADTPVLDGQVLLDAVNACVAAMNATATASETMAERGDPRWSRYFARAASHYAELGSDLVRLGKAIGDGRKIPRLRAGAVNAGGGSGYRVAAKAARRIARG